jgi:hypothetical protein
MAHFKTAKHMIFKAISILLVWMRGFSSLYPRPVISGTGATKQIHSEYLLPSRNLVVGQFSARRARSQQKSATLP